MPGRVPEIAPAGLSAGEGFVDHVPTGDPAPVMADHAGDVRAHPPQHQVASGQVVAVLEKPLRTMAVPDERVSVHPEAELFGHGHERVALLKRELSFDRLGGRRFEAVLTGDVREIRPQELLFGFREFGRNCRAHGKLFAVCALEGAGWFGSG